MRQAMIAVVLFTISGIVRRATADDNPKPSPEMLVLEDLVGVWDEVMTNKPTELMPQAETSTSVTRRAWALGGKFIRAEGRWEPAGTDCLHLFTYDPVENVYRSWYFDASGSMPRSLATGTWDAKTRTLTMRDLDSSGNTTVATERIIDRDHGEWTVVTKSPDGKVLLDLTGKCTRRKE